MAGLGNRSDAGEGGEGEGRCGFAARFGFPAGAAGWLLVPAAEGRAREGSKVGWV